MGEKEPISVEARDLIRKIEEDKKQKLLETLNYAIETQSRVELLVFNPPAYSKSTSRTVIVTPEKIENGYLHVRTKNNSKVATELSRIKRATIVGDWEK